MGAPAFIWAFLSSLGENGFSAACEEPSRTFAL
jgi:hypothetical protein